MINIMDTIRVSIVDDSLRFTNWLEEDLSVFSGINVTWKTDSVEKAKFLLDQYAVDILLLDLQLNDGYGIELIDYMKYKQIKPSIFILTAYPLPRIKEECLKMGAEGFYDKANDYFNLINTIRIFKNNSEYSDIF